MFTVENIQKFSFLNFSKLFFLHLALLILVFPSATLADTHPCKIASTHLRGDLNVTANRGGLWSLMEQKDLKDNSMIGMQADGKMARIVGQFETLCESEKKPTKQLFTSIQNALGEARVIFNPRSSGEEIEKLIKQLIKKLDILLAKME